MTSTTSTARDAPSDGIVNAPVSFAFAVIAVVGLTGCCWRARADLDERAVPMAGLVAAFIFAVQMINFPILPGVSGHLLGGALAAILVGPLRGCIVYRDRPGGTGIAVRRRRVSALGTNITNMALVSTFAGFPGRDGRSQVRRRPVGWARVDSGFVHRPAPHRKRSVRQPGS